MYEWDLGELGSPPLLGPALPDVYRARSGLIELARDAHQDVMVVRREGA
jgi:hypothetical protein